MKPRVTLEDVARKSNASLSTVSLVLRDKAGIGDETRQRVLTAAQELGYRRRLPRRAEADPAVVNVGLVFRSGERLRGARLPCVDAFYSWVLTGLETAARPHGINLLFATLAVDEENRALDLPDHLLEQPLAGLFLIGAFDAGSVAQVAASRPFPTVLVDAPDGLPGCDAVVSANEAAAAAAVEHLIALGHRRIVFVGSRLAANPNFRQRHDGYLRALHDHGLEREARLVLADDTAAAAEAWLHRYPEASAVFGCNDAYATAIVDAAQKVGRRVPQEISVVGFDDIEAAVGTIPPLTTMAVDKVGMGRLAVQAMTYRLAWPEAAAMVTVLRPTLIERGSTAAPQASPPPLRPNPTP